MKLTSKGFIHQLSFYPNLFPVNCYLIEESDELTLIDTALPNSSSTILKAAESIGKPISQIVLTHAHSDHIGSLDRLKESLPYAKVYMSEQESRLLAGDRSSVENETQNPVKGGIPKAGKIRTHPDFLIKEGDKIGSLRAIQTPGHSPGSTSLIDERTGAIIAGDAFQTRGGIAVSGHLKPLFPFPALATWSKEKALASAVKIHSLNPSLLAVGHGPMLIEPADEIDRAIIAFEKTLRKS
ncbi:MBL fold metallo-hydrolase [Jeotgalibacillus sp. JSM ZJ347]|uniref:MBL fold metallo-hydrolase n=1 Tax=Jeotgalibacillus sp. JSM ZJ347 TaxID=3342117 RepID=UPI0035A8BF82